MDTWTRKGSKWLRSMEGLITCTSGDWCLSFLNLGSAVCKSLMFHLTFLPQYHCPHHLHHYQVFHHNPGNIISYQLVSASQLNFSSFFCIQFHIFIVFITSSHWMIQTINFNDRPCLRNDWHVYINTHARLPPNGRFVCWLSGFEFSKIFVCLQHFWGTDKTGHDAGEEQVV